MARLCGRVKPFLQDRVHQDRSGGAHVERIDAPEQRERDEVVARARDPRAQPATLRAEHQDDPAGVVRGVVAGAGAGGGAVGPAAGLLGLAEEVQ